MCLLIAEASSDGTAQYWIIALLILIGAGNGVYLAFLHRRKMAQLRERDARIGNLMIPAKRRHALELGLVTKRQEILHLEEEISELLVLESNKPKQAAQK